MKTWTTDLVVEAQGAPAEGPIWDDRLEVLWWVDITGKAVHRYDPASKSDVSVQVPQDVGTVVPRESGGLVVALRDGFATLDFDSGELEWIAKVGDNAPHIRMNDGKCDPQGRLWAGTMAYDTTPGAGALYRLDPDATVTQMLDGVTISNGLAWTSDGSTMYYIDSMAGGVDAFDFHEQKFISNRRRVIELNPSDGLPDGMTLDADDCLWVAVHNAGQVRRYSLDGAHIGTVEVGVRPVTACWFGGPLLSDLYITTMYVEGIAHAGSLFVSDVGVSGVTANRFAG